ncbi:MAG: metal-dependent transcriptional regulator [Firmicutes bacterium]|nr:metal-dependent transcriptional regulator [Bacillota bacterium]
MKIQESAENYLEAILMLRERNGHVRSIDVANELNFTKASVSVAMKRFRQEEYIIVDAGGNITLTDKGMAIAQKIYERHKLIAKGLMALGVDEETAYEDSCRIEHDISDQSFEKLKVYLNEKGIE